MIPADQLSKVWNFETKIFTLNQTRLTPSNFYEIYLIIRFNPSSVASFDMLAYDEISIKFILVMGTYPVAPRALYGRNPAPNS